MGRVSWLGSTELIANTLGRVRSWGCIGGNMVPNSCHLSLARRGLRLSLLPPRSDCCLELLLGGTISEAKEALMEDSMTVGAGAADVDSSGNVLTAGSTSCSSSHTGDDWPDDGGVLSHRLAQWPPLMLVLGSCSPKNDECHVCDGASGAASEIAMLLGMGTSTRCHPLSSRNDAIS